MTHCIAIQHQVRNIRSGEQVVADSGQRHAQKPLHLIMNGDFAANLLSGWYYKKDTRKITVRIVKADLKQSKLPKNHAFRTYGSSNIRRVGSTNRARAKDIRMRQPPLNIFVGFVCISIVNPKPYKMRRAFASPDAAPI